MLACLSRFRGLKMFTSMVSSVYFKMQYITIRFFLPGQINISPHLTDYQLDVSNSTTIS